MIDMREIDPGCALDEFHFDMWTGFLRFMLEREEVRAEFERETGTIFVRPPRNPIEAAIDKAAGVDRSNGEYMAKFAAWVTPLYFGGPEDICPAIAKKLANG